MRVGVVDPRNIDGLVLVGELGDLNDSDAVLPKESRSDGDDE